MDKCPVCGCTESETLVTRHYGSDGSTSIHVSGYPWSITLPVCKKCGCVYVRQEVLTYQKNKEKENG